MEFEIREGFEAMDFERVHAWLVAAYWSVGVTRERVERAAHGSSLVLGAFAGGEQIGYTRVVSDRTTFAWVCDVYVDEAFRGRGVAKALVQHALDHSEHQGLRRWVLATADAQRVYSALGFDPLPNPERWMIRGRAIPTP
ncbi:MAG: GNAT family N-acetyltransferase [Fimbriimonas ginsengisoli]|uniref:GNAT family N-acetyltransferase n=1 Tax=Fimbriimonas ginsengisoli TaxID=1005039 RepID=A0A931M196_FIMGI|nr:GNAT family N-acetyltransferase [Fimbriimonas ginsengisoli]